MATIVKTKDLMIEVARQLFARVGFTNTTMNDIADASKKGPAYALYLFRNKDEIFHAVIERELERLWHDLELIRRLPASPEDKILTMLLTHLDKMKDLVLRNGSLRAEFFRDIWLVENSRAASTRRRSASSASSSRRGRKVDSSTSPTHASQPTSCRTSSRVWKSPSSVGLTAPRARSRRSAQQYATSCSSASARVKRYPTNPTLNTINNESTC